MALEDYILCDRCGCKLIYDGDRDNRDWLIERFGKEPEFYCPPCQQEMAMARVQLLGQRLDGAMANADARPSGPQEWIATQSSNAYRLDGFPESIGAVAVPSQIVWQGAVLAKEGALLRITGIHGAYLYVEPVETNTHEEVTHALVRKLMMIEDMVRATLATARGERQ